MTVIVTDSKMSVVMHIWYVQIVDTVHGRKINIIWGLKIEEGFFKTHSVHFLANLSKAHYTHAYSVRI